MKKSATATLLPVLQGSEVVVATIFNFYRFYGNKTGSISVIVKTMKKLDKWNATLTLIVIPTLELYRLSISSVMFGRLQTLKVGITFVVFDLE